MVRTSAFCVVLFVATCLLPASAVTTITYNGKAYWLNGVNVPWHNYGADVGGGAYSSSWFETFFADCQANGVNAVRLWVHCSGWATPEFDGSGNVTGLDATFLSDLDDILARAANHRVMVMPCLWSFDMTQDNNQNGIGLIMDQAKTQSYIDHALIPMVTRTANAPALLAWEISNEPEWSVTDSQVTKVCLQRFVAMLASAIHANCGKMVTVGSACLKWNSDVSPAEDNWWKESALRAQYNNAGAHMDFYQIHYYDWMVGSGWAYDPFQPDRNVSYWRLDKPVLVGECPADNTGRYTMQQMLQNAYANDYIGVMFWSYNSDWGGNWSLTKAQLKAMRDAHAGIIDFDPSAVRVAAGASTEPRVSAASRPLTVLDGLAAGAAPGIVRLDLMGRLVRPSVVRVGVNRQQASGLGASCQNSQ
jgi:hypothetical protein